MTRQAVRTDAAALTDLARAAKASWGYPAEWMAEWEAELTITPEYLASATVYVVPAEGSIQGMIAIIDGDDGPEIEHLWVSPDAQGRGLGRELIEAAQAHATEQGWRGLRVVSDPNAAPFYERLGGVHTGEVDAPVADVDRRLPVLSIPVSVVRTLILLASLALPAPAHAQFEDWTEPFAPVLIAPGLHYVGSAGLGAFLFTSADGHVLVDAPMAANVDLVLDNIRTAGFDPTDIRLHLASHAHYDHVGGLAGLMAATGGELWLSERDASFVSRGEDFGFDSEGYPPVTPSRTFADGEIVDAGEIRLTAHVTAGHTPGCTSWSGSLEIEGEARTFVIACSLSVLSMYRIAGPDPTYPDHGADYCRSVRSLRALDPQIFLAGHGSFFDLERRAAEARSGNPLAFVDSTGFTEWLDAAEVAIEDALVEQGHAGGCAALLGPG